MKNKGFTLIELLAVIVILAIVAIIAIPTILNVVERSRESSAVNSVYSYIHAIENSTAVTELKNGEIPEDKEYSTLRTFENKYGVKVKGTLPSVGKFTLDRRKVVDAEFIVDGYLIKCSKKICKSSGKTESVIVTYDLDGGEASKEADVIQKGASVQLPTPEKVGHTFDGWYDDGNNEVTNSTKFDSNTTVHAKYTINQYTVTLSNARFLDNSVSKTINYGETVMITAEIPEGTVEPEYTGATSCSCASDVGNVKYKINHGYVVDKWNVSNSKSGVIMYKVPAKSETVSVTLKEKDFQVDKQQCYASDALYADAYNYCNDNDTLSGTTCTHTTKSTYTAKTNYSCPSGYERSGSTCKTCSSSSYECYGDGWCGNVCNSYSTTSASVSYSCNSGDTRSGTTCTHTATSTYTASHVDGHYYCNNNGALDGTKCYNTQSID